MEETLASLKMKEFDLLNNLEKISSLIPNRILKVEGFILKENQKEHLEIIMKLHNIHNYDNPNIKSNRLMFNNYVHKKKKF